MKKSIGILCREDYMCFPFTALPYRVIIDEIFIHIVFLQFEEEDKQTVEKSERIKIKDEYKERKYHSDVIVNNVYYKEKPQEFLLWGYFSSDSAKNIFFLFKSVHYWNKTRVNLRKVRDVGWNCDVKAIMTGKFKHIKCLSVYEYFYDYKLEVLFQNDNLPNLEYLHIGDETNAHKIKGITFPKLKTLVLANETGLLLHNNVINVKTLKLYDPHVGWCGCYFDEIYKFPMENLTKVQFFMVFHFNWEVFATPEAQNLRFIDLYEICLSGMWCGFSEGYNGCKRCRQLSLVGNPEVIEWVPMKNLTKLRLYQCENVGDRSFCRQTFQNLRECYIKNCKGVTSKFVNKHSLETMAIKTL
jgi:hypothetical protein